MTDFMVRRDDPRQCRIVESRVPEPEAGQAVLRVDSVGLTTNNVTYALLGEAMSYWKFFPAEDGWGRVPMWGFAEVERSSVEGVEEGRRLYGYLPPSSHLLVTPADTGRSGFVDSSPHRAELPSAYHRYVDTATDRFYREDTEAIQMLLRPLFYTSFLIDDQLADDGLVGRGPVVISSASSKTAIAAAYQLSRRDGADLIGLTSPSNAAFVESLGVYGSVVPYGEVESLERAPASFVDFAGDAAVRRGVHERYGEELIHSMAAGITHGAGGAEIGGGGELPGPRPTFFFAPDRVRKRGEDWGRAGLDERVAEAWHPFCEWTASWLEVLHGSGFEDLRDGFVELLDGGPGPSRARVISVR